MKQFLMGLALGLLVGISSTVFAAKLLGDDGFLTGWEVTVGDETICSDPYIWTSTHEIECDDN